MAASYLRHDMTDSATFSLFVRRLPHQRTFLVAAGLEDALRMLVEFAFDESDLAWLAAQGFPADAIEAFAGLRFTGDVWAVAEGELVFADEPLLEVTAPLPEAQLVETVLLNQITFQTALATKAARCRLAVAGRAELVDFAFRRTHGIEAGVRAARAAAMAGFVGTSNVLAARHLDIRPIGTMAHSYIEAFADERRAFTTFARDFPDRTTFLVDTYDTLAGVENAVAVIDELDLTGSLAVRLDSGDLLGLSTATRRLLDERGRPEVAIVASGGLDEHEVARLLDAGAPIDVFGVGTRIGVSGDAPALDSAYKLVEYAGNPVMKLSTGKETLPCAKQVYRTGLDGPDLLTGRSEPPPATGRPLLRHVMADGRRISATEPLATIRDRLTGVLDTLPPDLADLRADAHSRIDVSPVLRNVADELADELRGRMA